MDEIIFKPLKVNRINQFERPESKGVYFGIWSFSEIVYSIKFTHREPLKFDIFKQDPELKKKYPEFDSDYYQRLINDDRTKKVIQFVIKEIEKSYDEKKESLITFPTSLILSLYLTEAEELEEYKSELKEINNLSFFEGNIGVYLDEKANEVHLPDKNVMLIVDGQHRLAALYAIYHAIQDLENPKIFNETQLDKKLIEYAQRAILKLELNREQLTELKGKVEKFQFSCTILMDYDIWEQGKVFADVNFNQKPVNKSLYYDIFGSYPDPERNDIYLAHTWTVYLNSQPKTALEKKIKLLGRGEGYFSQAFFVEALLPHLRKNGIWNNVVSDFILHEKVDNKIPIFLKLYFNSIEALYKDFAPIEGKKPSEYKNILFKTTGLGALIKLIPKIYKIVEDKLYENDETIMDLIKVKFTQKLTLSEKEIDDKISQLKKNLESLNSTNEAEKVRQIESEIRTSTEKKELILKKITGEYYFSGNTSVYAKAGSKGLQDKLYDELVQDLGLK